MNTTDRNMSLEAIEGDVWSPLKAYPTRLVERCYWLRKIPIGKLSVEDLRLLIGQGIGLKHLMPLAIEIFREDPLAEGDLYPGDLLKNVLNVPADFWREYPDQNTEVLRLAEPVRDQLPK